MRALMESNKLMRDSISERMLLHNLRLSYLRKLNNFYIRNNYEKDDFQDEKNRFNQMLSTTSVVNMTK